MVQGRTLSAEIVSTVLDAVGVATEQGATALAPGVRRLSEMFTRRREALRGAYLDDASLRRSYLAYFALVNLGKVQGVLSELPGLDWAAQVSARGFRLLDAGSGPGTAALGTLDWLHRRVASGGGQIEVSLVDASRPALDTAQSLMEAYAERTAGLKVRSRCVPANLERKNEWLRKLAGPYDLIVMANCLNELYTAHQDPCAARTKLVLALLAVLRDDGNLVLIEPATRAESRAFLRVRDAVLRQGACTVYSPCLREGPCPALIKLDDWCHEERPWQAPWIVERIDREVGLIKDALKFSYLVLRKDGLTVASRDSGVFRVVSELRCMKGEKRAWLCNETGRLEVGRLDRLRSASNRSFDSWHRGAIVKVDEIMYKSGSEPPAREEEDTAAGVKPGRGKGPLNRAVGRIPMSSSVQMLRSIGESGEVEP